MINPPRYLLKEIPAEELFTPAPNGFSHALPAWTRLGFGPVVEHVRGNGVLVDQSEYGHALIVWPPHEERPEQLGYDPANCKLVEIDEACSAFWLDGKTPPGPADLDNGNPLNLPCKPLRLADGRTWEIPEIREPTNPLMPRLPRKISRDRLTGDLKCEVMPRYRRLWEETEQWMAMFLQVTDGKRSVIPIERALAFATSVLGLRYHFTDATQSALNVIDDSNIQELISVAIGWAATWELLERAVQVVEKKNVTP